jgi:hypothetical protein
MLTWLLQVFTDADSRSSASCVVGSARRERVDSDGQKSDAHAGEHRGIFADERGQLRMRGFELFNGLF